MFGADQQEPGWFPTFNPNDFDIAVKSVSAKMLDNYNVDFINPKAYWNVGLFNGPVKNFIKRYMAIARAVKQPYLYQSQWNGWSKIYRKNYGKDDAVYFRAFRLAAGEGKIPESILRPWTYNPESDLRGTFLSKRLVIGGVALVAFAYALPTALVLFTRGKK